MPSKKKIIFFLCKYKMNSGVERLTKERKITKFILHAYVKEVLMTFMSYG